MAAAQQKFFPNPLKSIDSASFTGSYISVGTPLETATRVVKFTNNSNQLITISWNGIDDHDALPPGSFLLIDVSSNREVTGICEIEVGTQFYIKGSVGTGFVYISSYFAR